MSKKRGRTDINLRDVPKSVTDLFKAHCAERGFTMRAAVVALMRRTVTEGLTLTQYFRKDD